MKGEGIFDFVAVGLIIFLGAFGGIVLMVQLFVNPEGLFGVEQDYACKSLDMNYVGGTICLDGEGNRWGLYYHPKEGLFGHEVWRRDDCALKCYGNRCSDEYGDICESTLLTGRKS